ncbi:glutathione peroxidase [Cyberlindnera jadinii NRRL Y-1542]|uniref:Ure2p in complex with S-P-Nitrobenzylglutathione n=2 Tax=Cyberlindnera jadinii (strain ATCC 18201 / CBS 1600 / BCRC 20928 / JCM 3617 / NBRC 0987 / NRRL Y-1542) TaxID=983966 RepID=A0A1E4S3E5_CYBJN|nr:Ure2p in complex with S-P-Nitrobenzylglutathione [Cyberlindnera jadinii NRRL Y-1542]ODV74038.1 Ure2p in complex with S-P-Nitrobenzylglutathione [Cyberlindnera jadinii NRRL Y-1542]
MNREHISNLSSALRQVSISQDPQQAQQQSTANSNAQLQHLESSFGNQSQQTQSRITHFFKNQPEEGFTLFSHRSAPNGFKVAIVLSELGLEYNTIFLDFNAGEQRAPEFVSINPNARVPALIDHSNDNLSIWESGAIILYLSVLYGLQTISEQSQIMSWVFFQTSGHAPMIGQALHFRYFHTQQVPSAVQRYTDEVRRVYGVVEMALAERREALIMELDTENAAAYSAGTTPLSQSKFFDYPVWLVGERISIADLAFVPWNNVVDRIGIDIKQEFPEVYKWTKNMMRRPAVVRALRGEQ